MIAVWSVSMTIASCFCRCQYRQFARRAGISPELLRTLIIRGCYTLCPQTALLLELLETRGLYHSCLYRRSAFAPYINVLTYLLTLFRNRNSLKFDHNGTWFWLAFGIRSRPKYNHLWTVISCPCLLSLVDVHQRVSVRTDGHCRVITTPVVGTGRQAGRQAGN